VSFRFGGTDYTPETVATPDLRFDLLSDDTTNRLDFTETGTISFSTYDHHLYYPAFQNRRTRLLEQSRFKRVNHRGLEPRAAHVNFQNATPAELTALQLLRQLIGQTEFRRYLRYGFVVVTGRSGLRYQVVRDRHVIVVWGRYGRLDSICCYLAGPFPPTDAVITRMLMAERDELELWRRGNSRLGRDVTLQDLERLVQGENRRVA
jgi:hypothetical protein